MAKQKEIGDFGEKIGGARKDLAAFKKLGYFDIDAAAEWTDIERSKYIVKAKVFDKPDYQKLYDSQEYSREALYFISEVYKALPAKPDLATGFYGILREIDDPAEKRQREQELIRERQNDYITLLNTVRDALKGVRSQEDIIAVSTELATAINTTPELQTNLRDSKALRKLNDALRTTDYGVRSMITSMKSAQFLYTDEEKALDDVLVVQIQKGASRTVEADPEWSRVALKQGGSTYYYYDRNLEDTDRMIDPDSYKEGKFVAAVAPRTKSGVERTIIGIDYDTKEEAQQAAIEYIQNAVQAEKARKATERKERLLPPQLAHIHRVGEDYLNGGNVEVRQKTDENGQPMFETFSDGTRKKDDKGRDIPIYECPHFQEGGLSLRAVEFGVWENQNDRQTNLDMAYDSFKDMAKALGIAESDASLGGDLALAFGSRGRGGAGAALAHFEPDKNVINLTKMRGAGALGHEWGHALDYAIARMENRVIREKTGHMETDFAHQKDSILNEVYEAMMRKPDGTRSDFYADARVIGGGHAKEDKGYWDSPVEMFARAFHTYLQDKLKENGIRNDYLCGLAEYPPVTDQRGVQHYTYPRGEERERINKAFDNLVQKLLERGMFHEQGAEQEHQLVHSQDGILQQETAEQLEFVFNEQVEIEKSEPKAAEQTEKAEPETVTQPSSQAVEELAAKAKALIEQTKLAKSLQVGDIIKLEPDTGYTTLDGRSGSPQMTAEYARVTEVDDDHIAFRTHPTDPTVPDKWDNGAEAVMTVGDRHWSANIASRGFEPVSVKALEQEQEQTQETQEQTEQETIDTNEWKEKLDNYGVDSIESLANEIGYGFTKSDIAELAILHRDSEQETQDKIEALLTACNFHTEANDFFEGKYDAYIPKEQAAEQTVENSVETVENENEPRAFVLHNDVGLYITTKPEEFNVPNLIDYGLVLSNLAEGGKIIVTYDYDAQEATVQANTEKHESPMFYHFDLNEVGAVERLKETLNDEIKALGNAINEECVHYTDDRSTMVYFHSEDDEKMSAMKSYIDNIYPHGVWNEDNTAVELSTRQAEMLKQSFEVESQSRFMQEVVKSIAISVGEPFPEDKEEPDFVHVVYVRGDEEAIDKLKEVGADFIMNWGSGHGETAFAITDKSLESFQEYLQSEAVQNDNLLIQTLSRVDYSLNKPFEQEIQERGNPMDNKWRKQAETETEPPKKGSFKISEESKEQPQEKLQEASSAALQQLEDTMKEHKPYAVIAFSTSGVRSDSEPIRVVVQEYTFDDELQKYTKGLTFDEQVKCSQAQLDVMLNSTGYDYFGNAGIDREQYVKGEGVHAKEEASADFVKFMQALQQDTTFIINGTPKFAENTLSNLSAEALQAFLEKEKNGTVLAQVSLTADYLKAHGYTGKADLENLRSHIVPHPTSSFRPLLKEDPEREEQFKTMSKEDFMKAANVSSWEYDQTVADYNLHEGKIVGADKRIDMIAQFVETYGREQNILESEMHSRWREADVAQHEAWSSRGRERYENSEFEGKLAILVQQSHMDTEAVQDRSSNCELNKMLNVLEGNGVDGNGHNKGFVIMQAATTGFDRRGVGEPTQVTAIAYVIGDDGIARLDPEQPKISNMTIEASARAVQTAIQKAEKGGFDVFKDAGIDVAKYQSGEGVFSQENANAALAAFFAKYPPEDFPIISNGRGKNVPEVTFSQEALQRLGNVPAMSDSEHTVDFTRALQEYAYMAYHAGVENAVLNENTIKDFKLATIVADNDDIRNALTKGGTLPESEATVSTRNKVYAVAFLAHEIQLQDLEMTRPELYAAYVQAQEAEAQRQGVGQEGQAEKTETTHEEPAVENTVETVEEENEFVAPLFGGDMGVDIAELVDDLDDVVAKAPEPQKDNTREVVVAEGDEKTVTKAPAQPVREETTKEQPKEQEKTDNTPHSRMTERRRRAAEGRKEGDNEGKKRFTPTRKEQPSQEQTEQTTQAAPSADVAALMAVLAETQRQNAALIEQNAVLIQQSQAQQTVLVQLAEKVLGVQEQQADLLKTVLLERSPELAQEQTAGKEYKDMTPAEKIEAIEKVKDSIVEIKDTLAKPSREATFLSNANLQLSNIQKKLEEPVKKEVPNKA